MCFLFQLMCCGGSHGPSDWDNNIYFNCSSNVLINGVPFVPIEACGVPFSCCLREAGITKNAQCGFGVRKLSVCIVCYLKFTVFYKFS